MEQRTASALARLRKTCKPADVFATFTFKVFRSLTATAFALRCLQNDFALISFRRTDKKLSQRARTESAQGARAFLSCGYIHEG